MSNKVKIYGGPNVQWYIITLGVFLLWGIAGLSIWLGFNILVTISVCLYIKYRHVCIINSLLDTDWYKITMGQAVFHQFPNAIARYQFINRGKIEFPKGFDESLRKELKHLGKVRLTDYEWNWLFDQLIFKADYLTWLAEYQFDPSQVFIEQNEGNLDIIIEGWWAEAILWEVPLMAIISELYFKMTNKEFDPIDFGIRTRRKADKMLNGNVKWSDFGTRRRFSFAAQDLLNSIMLDYAPSYIGTSNPYFAMKYGLKPIGTYAHEAVMAMQVAYNAKEANQKWMEHWWNEYWAFPNLLVALTDTLTTDVFLKTYSGDMLNKYSGVRQDSGNPFDFAKKLIQYYKDKGIDPKDKKIVFSDSLDADKVCELQKTFGNEIPCVMGIGTNLTNDCDEKPLNMVIKLVAIDFGGGFRSVVKLSDDEGKYTGNLTRIKMVKEELGI